MNPQKLLQCWVRPTMTNASISNIVRLESYTMTNDIKGKMISTQHQNSDNIPRKRHPENQSNSRSTAWSGTPNQIPPQIHSWRHGMTSQIMVISLHSQIASCSLIHSYSSGELEPVFAKMGRTKKMRVWTNWYPSNTESAEQPFSHRKNCPEM